MWIRRTALITMLRPQNLCVFPIYFLCGYMIYAPKRHSDNRLSEVRYLCPIQGAAKNECVLQLRSNQYRNAGFRIGHNCLSVAITALCCTSMLRGFIAQIYEHVMTQRPSTLLCCVIGTLCCHWCRGITCTGKLL